MKTVSPWIIADSSLNPASREPAPRLITEQLHVVGAGCELVNGVYNRNTDDYNGRPYYQNPETRVELWYNNEEWRIGR